MKGDKRCKKREREDPKCKFRVWGELGGVALLYKIKAHHTVSPTGRNAVFPADMFSILSFLPAFLLQSFYWGVGCLNTP